MPKLKDVEIKVNDIQEFLDSSSDFAFEMQVLKMMNEAGCKVVHGGLYHDGVTGKTRQFDIRANLSKTQQDNMNLSVRMAIECKNLRKNYPLVVLGTQRVMGESSHDICDFMHISHNNYTNDKLTSSKSLGYWPKTRNKKESQFYPHAEFVGKSFSQVGRSSNGDITATDSEVYDKWTQALSSIHGMMKEIIHELKNQVDKRGFASGSFVFLPVLVVPDKMLWIAQYDENGSQVADAKQIERCQYFVNELYEIRREERELKYNVSHLEIMTLSGLKSFVADENIWGKLFPARK